MPWYKSAIIRQQIVQLILALVAILGINIDGLDVDATVQTLFAAVGALVAIWTIVTRLFKPAPNLTPTAAAKEQDLRERGVIPDHQ